MVGLLEDSPYTGWIFEGKKIMCPTWGDLSWHIPLDYKRNLMPLQLALLLRVSFLGLDYCVYSLGVCIADTALTKDFISNVCTDFCNQLLYTVSRFCFVRASLLECIAVMKGWKCYTQKEVEKR